MSKSHKLKTLSKPFKTSLISSTVLKKHQMKHRFFQRIGLTLLLQPQRETSIMRSRSSILFKKVALKMLLSGKEGNKMNEMKTKFV